MHRVSNLRKELKEAKALNEKQRRTIRGLQVVLWMALIGWTITLASGIALWKITEKSAPSPIRLMEPDFGWGYNRGY